MSEAYERARGGRLTFKGGDLAVRQSSLKKKTKKKPKSNPKADSLDAENPAESGAVAGVPADSDASEVREGGEGIYTIDAAKKMKYDELFPVEAKKFGYEPKAKATSVEDALDDRVRKKADRYCK